MDFFKQMMQNPWMGKAIWSFSTIAAVIIGFYSLRWLLMTMGVGDGKLDRYRRWGVRLAILIGFVLLLYLWFYQWMIEWFDTPVAENIVQSIFWLITTLLLIWFFRKCVADKSYPIEKSKQIRSRIVGIILILYALVLYRIWAFSDRSEFMSSSLVDKLFKSLLIFAFIYAILFFIRRYINAMKVEIVKRHQYRKRASYAAAFVYILALLPLWAGTTQQWATVLSVMGAGIALALHEVLLNIAGWLYIMIRRPYREGDRIELGTVRGDVIDIQVLQTTLLEIGNWVDGDQSTGRIVHLPHGQIFRAALYNYTRGFEFIWNEISILVTFESHWEKAKEILLELGTTQSREIQESVKHKIDRMAREYLIYYRTLTPIVYTKIEDSGIKLTLRFLTDAKKRRAGDDEINRNILTAINAAEDIEFAYPTYRITGDMGNTPSS